MSQSMKYADVEPVTLERFKALRKDLTYRMTNPALLGYCDPLTLSLLRRIEWLSDHLSDEFIYMHGVTDEDMAWRDI